jgi:hypothetical protein
MLHDVGCCYATKLGLIIRQRQTFWVLGHLRGKWSSVASCRTPPDDTSVNGCLEWLGIPSNCRFCSTMHVGLPIRMSHDNVLGSMLWSQFSAIFANFRRKICRFSQKPMLWSQFLQKLTEVWEKSAKIFAKFFGENILKIITSVPGPRD